MLEKNLNALELKKPELAQKLRDMPRPELEVYRAVSEDIIIAYNGVCLHSDENPVKEAEELFAPKIPFDGPNSIFIIYGLGLGYLFKRSTISVNGKIILYEPFIDVLRFTLEYVDFSKEIADDNIYICTSLDEIMQILNEKYLIGDSLEISFLPEYLKLDMSYISKLTERIVSFIKTKQQDQSTVLNRSLEWTLSCLKNADEVIKTPEINIFEDQFSKYPVLIASAGPSLEGNLDLIKKNKDKFILVAVNTALRALLKNDIIPDFCVVAESFNIDYQFKDLKNLDKVHFILHPRVTDFIWKLPAQKYLYLTQTDGFSNWINDLTENKFHLLPSAGTVSLIAFYVATNVFKSKNIILVGQDLAFVDNKFYSESAMGDIEQIEIEGNIIKAKAANLAREKGLQNLETLLINNSLGEKVLTGRDYNEYIYQYEDIIGNELPRDTKVFNTSLKGAYIQGMIYKPLEDIIPELKSLDIDVSETKLKLTKENEPNVKEIKDMLAPKFDEFYTKLKKINARCPHLLRFLENYNKKLSEDAANDVLMFLASSYFDYKKELTEFVSNQSVLFSMLQKAKYYYVRRYIQVPEGVNLNKEQFTANMFTEKLLIESIQDALSQIESIKLEKTPS